MIKKIITKITKLISKITTMIIRSLPEQSLKAYNLIVKCQKNHTNKLFHGNCMANIFNFTGIPLNSIRELLAKKRSPWSVEGLL